MNKLILVPIFLAVFVFIPFHTSAQYQATLTGSLDSNTPPAQTLQDNAQNVDVARIKLSASGFDVFLNGIYMATDVPGGLDNFTNFLIYDTKNGLTLLGTWPSQSENPNLVQFSNVTIGNGMSKTYLVRASLAPDAAGEVRVGFSDFTFSNQDTPILADIPIYGNVMTLPGETSTPAPTPTPTPTPDSTGSPQATPTPTPTTFITPESLGFTTLASLTLVEGDIISAAGSDLPASEVGDPDVYIANEWGYKRLFLNPVIFGFYGHLGGFSKVKTISSSVRDIMVTSGLFRNCETNDEKIYGVETTGEDTGILHWINMTGDQAVAEDPNFFKKVFCINSNEFNWYSVGSDYTSLSQVPSYTR